MDGITLNDNGTIDVGLDDRVVHLRRPKTREFRELVELLDATDQEWAKIVSPEGGVTYPQEIVDQAAELAVNDFRARNGRSPGKSLVDKNDLNDRAVAYTQLMWANRQLNKEGERFAKVWARLIAVLGNETVQADDLPSWAMNPSSLGPLRDHWMNFPLHLGPLAERAAQNGQDSAQTTTSDA